MPPIRLLLAEDNDMYRDSFSLVINNNPALQLCGVAGNGSELMPIAQALCPDLVVINTCMPLLDAVAACRQLVQQQPAPGIIGLGMHALDNQALPMLQAGARGYLIKNTNPAEIYHCLQRVHAGGTYFCADITPLLSRALAPALAMPHFTLTERQIFEGLCLEKDLSMIARELHKSHHTLLGQCKKLLRKCSVSSQLGLVKYAIENGLEQAPAA